MSDFHKHMIVSGKLRSPLYSCEFFEDWFERLVDSINMNILIPPKMVYCDTPGNEGITGIVCIDTSHASIHVWNKTEVTFKFDLYSCKQFSEDVVIDALKELDPYYVSYDVYDRSSTIKLISKSDVQIIPISSLLTEEERYWYKKEYNSVPYKEKTDDQKNAIKKYNKLAHMYDVKTINRNIKRKYNNTSTLDVIRSRCGKKGLEFDLTEDWYTNEFLKAKNRWPLLVRHSRDRTFWRANVDRKDPEQGYTQTNCRIIPEGLNTTKNNYDREELQQLVELLKEEVNNG